MTSWSLVTSLPRQSSLWPSKSRPWRSWSACRKLIKRIAMTTQVYPLWRETCTSNLHVQPLLLLIQTWHWLSSPIKHGIWISRVCGSWIISLPLTMVATCCGLYAGHDCKNGKLYAFCIVPYGRRTDRGSKYLFVKDTGSGSLTLPGNFLVFAP